MTAEFIDGELHVMSLQRASFSYDEAHFEGAIALEQDLLQELTELERQPDEYGETLFRAVFTDPELKQGLDSARAAARREGKVLSFRLRLAHDLPSRVHELFWELLQDGEGFVPARSHEAAFSRFNVIGREPGKGLTTGSRPRLLAVVSAPADVGRYRLAELEFGEHVERLTKALAPARKAIEVDFLDPPITARRIRERLLTDRYSFLHLVGHGTVGRHEGSCLVLQNDKGLAEFLDERDFFEIFKGCRALRLVTLIACSSAKASSGGVGSGLAGRLVSQGVPAVVAMRRDVTVDKGYDFTRYFYEQWVRHRRLDVAVNEARQHLYLDDRKNLAWSIPVLYMRSRDNASLPWKGAPAKPRRTRIWVALAVLLALLAVWWAYDSIPLKEPPTPPDSTSPESIIRSTMTAFVEVSRLQKPPYAEGTVGLYLLLPQDAADTSDWRRRAESSLERAIAGPGLELVATTNASLLAVVELEILVLEDGRLNGAASTTCQLRAKFQIYHQRHRVATDAVAAKAQQFDRREACLAAVDRLANEVGSRIVAAYLDL